MQNAVKMKSDRVVLKAFVERAGLDPKKLNNPNKNWILPAAFTFVTHNEKQGWKGARVVEYLHSVKNVPIKDLAEQIRKLGGIERIVDLAAKEDPRRVKPLGGIQKGGKVRSAANKNLIKAVNVREESNGNDVDETDDWDVMIDDDDHDENGGRAPQQRPLALRAGQYTARSAR
jgi:hypothetical protein